MLPASRCEACGHISCPPVAFCPQGCGRRHGPTEIAALGTVYSSTLVHVPHPELGAPYQVAYVDLADGPRIFGRVVPATPLAEIHGTVDVALAPDGDGRPTVTFTPLELPA